jgi:hypothetical protein
MPRPRQARTQAGSPDSYVMQQKNNICTSKGDRKDRPYNNTARVSLVFIVESILTVALTYTYFIRQLILIEYN